MAGLGRRTFAPGEVLTATNVMGYLQDQAVMKFAGTAARGSAIGTAVAEGMVSYLADTDLVEAYDGSGWKTLAATSGNVLQTVTANQTSNQQTASTSFVDAHSVSITPKRADSTIEVKAYFYSLSYTTASQASTRTEYCLTNSSNTTLTGAELAVNGFYDGTTNPKEVYASLVLRGTVAAGDTSARTYKLRMKCASSNQVGGAYGAFSTTVLVARELGA